MDELKNFCLSPSQILLDPPNIIGFSNEGEPVYPEPFNDKCFCQVCNHLALKIKRILGWITPEMEEFIRCNFLVTSDDEILQNNDYAEYRDYVTNFDSIYGELLNDPINYFQKMKMNDYT